MKTFFEVLENRLALRRAAEGWRGTKWVLGSAIRGVGADCQSLCCALYYETGVFAERVVMPSRGFGSRHAAKAAAWLDSRPEFARCEEAPLAGDLFLLTNDGRLHFAVAIPGEAGEAVPTEIVQCLGSQGVHFHSIHDPSLIRARFGRWRPV